MLDTLIKGGRCVLQPACGYLATDLNDVMSRRNDAETGARPGRLVRGWGATVAGAM